MRILIAPDSFKETMTATEAAEAMRRGVLRAMPSADVDLCPVADGGEGILEALVTATGGEARSTTTVGPLGEPLKAAWGLLGDGKTAIVEMAQAAGLALVPPAQRDSMRTTTFGVGELIRAALDACVSRIIVGIGGSATNDAGAGMAQALGVRFDDITMPLTGGHLAAIKHIDLSGRDRRLDHTDIVVACDVNNPLFGPEGAAHVYAPQKGATPGSVEALDRGLRHLATLVPNVDPKLPGAGAAGGLGFGLVAFCGAKLVRGIELVLDAVKFDERVARADLVLTGEGRIDGQSIRGKVCIGVAQAAAKHHKPTIALVGSAGPDAHKTLAHGLTAYHPLVDGKVTVEQAMKNGPQYLEELAARITPRYAQ
jgi:glycerate kinase